MQTNYKRKDTNKMQLKRATKCIYYWEIDYDLKKHYQVF